MTNNELIKISKELSKMSYEESQKYANSPDFVNFVNSIDNMYKPTELKNAIIHIMQVKKNEEGYFQDAFNNNISYNGIKTLKREGVKIKWSALQASEYTKCSKSFDYFFYNYCKIMTKKGYDFPEVRKYQLEILEAMRDNHRVLLSISRQMGKTVLVASYILWKTIFGKNTTHGIVGQLTSTGIEVLDKIKSILFGLPFAFLPGTTVFNKRSIAFDNGVRILTSSANGNAFRGFSIIGEELDESVQPSGAVLYIDECAYISSNDIAEFEDSVLPTVESANNSQIFKSSTAKGRNHWYFDVKKALDNKELVQGDFKIDGVEISKINISDFNNKNNKSNKSNKSNKHKTIKKITKTDGGYLIERFVGKSGYRIVEANYLDKFENDPKGAQEFKDRIVADKGLMFFQQAYANEFIGSSATLIQDKIIESIKYMDEDDIIFNTIFKGLRIFNEPVPGHNYIITCDPKKDGINEVGIHVIDVTSIPFVQVATAQLMESYLVVPGRLFDLGNYYNKAMVICENNIAESIPTTLYYNYEYEGEIFVERNKKGKKKNEMGARTTTRTKKIGLTMLKSFIESEKLIIQDFQTVKQLYDFVEHENGTFGAIEGGKDDLIMSLMLTFFPFFKFKNWDNFKGFATLLEKQKELDELEEQETVKFLDLGFNQEEIDELPFTEDVWDEWDEWDEKNNDFNDGINKRELDDWERYKDYPIQIQKLTEYML